MALHSGQQAQQGTWLLKAGGVATVLATAVGFVADVDSLLGFSRILLSAAAAVVGLGALGAGLVLYVRQWGSPLGWAATKGMLWAAAGLLLCTISAIALMPELATQGSNMPANAAPLSLTAGGLQAKANLDPGAGQADFVLREGPVLDRAEDNYGNPVRTLFVQVASATSQACGTAKGWTQTIEPVQDQLICVKTDQARYVVIEILSATKSMIAFRRLHVQPLPGESMEPLE